MDREARNHRSLGRLLGAALMALLMVGCSEPPRAQLTVRPSVLVVTGTAGSGFFVGNAGEEGSTLRFSVETDATWLSVEPSVGQVAAGASSGLAVSVLPGMTPPPGTSAEVRVETNAGTATVRVGVRRSAGVSICAHGLHDPGVAPTGHAAGSGQQAGLAAPAPGALVAALPDAGALSVGGGARPNGDSEVLVVYHEHVSVSATSVGRAALSGEVAARAGAALLRAGVQGQHDLMRLPAGATGAALAALERDPRVALVVPNVSVHRLATAPNDPSYADQWWAWCFGAREAWAVNSGEVAAAGDDVVVAVVDDGFNPSHADLAPKLLPGFDLAELNADVRTTSPHGSHVAGIALAAGDNGIAIAGLAHGASVRLLPVKVFPDDTRLNGDLNDLVNGMRWAVGLPVAGAPPNENPAHVVNLSLGVGSSPPTSTAALLQATVDDLRKQGAVVVAAAGNRGTSQGVEYPARAEGAISVGSVDWTGIRSPFSTFGAGLDLMAPGGVAHPSTADNCRYVLSLGASNDEALYCQPGTSMAAPFVSAAAALLMAHDPATFRADPAAVEARLLATTLRDDGMSVSEYGAGIVCPDAALGAPTRCGWSPDE